MFSGMIIIWPRSIGTIPDGYVLCDGNNSTPDLRNKFVVGAGDSYAVDATGGNATHTHAFTSNLHNHDLNTPGPIGSGANFDHETTAVAVTGTTDSGSSLPPYHALCYIMKT